MNPFTAQRKHVAVEDAETQGMVADSMAVRRELIRRMEAGEITHEQVKEEILRLKRTAKKNGLITRNQAFIRG